MSVPKGDYIGFTFNGKHSSSFGIVRTSDGSRFNQNLLPTFQDKVVPVPGRDGAYYFGSNYGQRQINIQFAFDELTEQQIANLRKWLGDKKIHPLILDELPYKEYQVKVTGSATIKFIPFAEGKTNRLYKGEGNIQFTAFYPYARAPYKTLGEYKNSNVMEWAAASGIKEALGDIDEFHNKRIKLYNPGDVDTDWRLIIGFQSQHLPDGVLRCNGEALYFDTIEKKGNDSGVIFNSNNNLIEGYEENDGEKYKSGNIYNEAIYNGNFFKIPPCEESFFGIETLKSTTDLIESYINPGSSPLEYSYLYF